MFHYDTAHKYFVGIKLKKDACKLKKLPFIPNQEISSFMIKSLREIDNFNLYISRDSDSSLFDAVLTFYPVQENKENFTSEYGILLWSAKLDIYNYVLKSLDKNYSSGKVSILLELTGNQVEIYLVLESSSFSTVECADEIKSLSNNIFVGRENTLKPIMQYLYTLKDDCIQYEYEEEIEKKSINDLYLHVKTHNKSDKNEDLRYKYQHELLIPSLRCYQAEAVNWMIFKETQDNYETGSYFT